MDRKELKQAGKKLFKKNYWYSVLVAFLMAFTGTATASPSFNFSFNTTSSGDASFEEAFGGGGNADFFFDEFINTMCQSTGFLFV